MKKTNTGKYNKKKKRNSVVFEVKRPKKKEKKAGIDEKRNRERINEKQK